jgi:hypothetical protein
MRVIINAPLILDSLPLQLLLVVDSEGCLVGVFVVGSCAFRFIFVELLQYFIVTLLVVRIVTDDVSGVEVVVGLHHVQLSVVHLVYLVECHVLLLILLLLLLNLLQLLLLSLGSHDLGLIDSLGISLPLSVLPHLLVHLPQHLPLLLAPHLVLLAPQSLVVHPLHLRLLALLNDLLSHSAAGEFSSALQSLKLFLGDSAALVSDVEWELESLDLLPELDWVVTLYHFKYFISYIFLCFILKFIDFFSQLLLILN